jgi:sugar lactone lactonase YvrE
MMSCSRTGRQRQNCRIALLSILALLVAFLTSLTASAPSNATTAVVAGVGVDGYNGSNIAATTAKLWGPQGLAVNSSGEVFIVEMYNEIVRKIDTSGNIQLVSGQPQAVRSIANGGYYHPMGIAISASGTVFVSDALHNVVFAGNTVFAGNDIGAGGNAGDGGLAHSNGTKLSQPAGLAYDDSTSTLYIVDRYNCTVRMVHGGYINRIAGTGTCGYSTGSGVATNAKLSYATSVAISRGKVYIADTSNNRIRVVDPVANTISDLGTGSSSDTGDGGAATSAGIVAPKGLVTDPAGNIFVGTGGGRIREINVMGNINTIGAIIGSVQGMAFDPVTTNIYASSSNQNVYKINGTPPAQPSNSCLDRDAVAVRCLSQADDRHRPEC